MGNHAERGAFSAHFREIPSYLLAVEKLFSIEVNMNYVKAMIFLWIMLTGIYAEYPENSPVARHGKLQVTGTFLCNEAGDTIQLRGVSTHGLQWFGEFIHEKSIKMLAHEWKADIIRASMYTAPEAQGYIENPDLKNKVIEVVNLAEKYGLYCLIDWHQLSDNDPNTYKEEAKEFFNEMVTLFKDKKHVLYEICNEPDDRVSWKNAIKPYAEELIPVIQNVDEKAIVIVGTPFWCQDVDVAANSPIEGKNIMYTLHFYAGEHGKWVQNKFKNAVTRIPIFATEFGTTMADGDRGVYINETNHWLHLLHEHKVSWINWSISDKNEDCAILKPGTAADGDWSDEDLTRSGKYIKERLINGYSEGPYSITIPECKNGRVEITPKKEKYEFGEEVSIEAIPDEGYTFHSWHGLTTSENPAQITVGGDFDCWPEILHGKEKIVNGDFSSGQDPWKFIAWGDASAETKVEHGQIEVVIDEAGKDPWEIQLEQKELTIEQGRIYRLQFSASADEEREIVANVGMSKEPWDTYSNLGNISIGPEKKTIRKTFTMKNSTDRNARLFFDLGKHSSANVRISNVSLIDTTEIIPILHSKETSHSGVEVTHTKEHIRLTIPHAVRGARVKLFNVQGQELYNMPLNSETATIDCDALALSRGIFLLKVIHGNRVAYHTLQL